MGTSMKTIATVITTLALDLVVSFAASNSAIFKLKFQEITLPTRLYSLHVKRQMTI